MRTFFAAIGNIAFMGGLPECIAWAEVQIENRKARIVKILKARPNQKDARIIFEVTKDGTHATSNGRTISLSLLKRALKDGKEEKST